MPLYLLLLPLLQSWQWCLAPTPGPGASCAFEWEIHNTSQVVLFPLKPPELNSDWESAYILLQPFQPPSSSP